MVTGKVNVFGADSDILGLLYHFQKYKQYYFEELKMIRLLSKEAKKVRAQFFLFILFVWICDTNFMFYYEKTQLQH